MDEPIDKSAETGKNKKKKLVPLNEENFSGKDEEKIKKKEINSWDCSTPSNKGEEGIKKSNDWDSSSDCHEETLVEPFDVDLKGDWPSESENKSVSKFSFEENKDLQLWIKNSSDSLDLSVVESNETDRNSLIDARSILSSSLRLSERRLHKSEDALFVEDIEEFSRNEPESKILKPVNKKEVNLFSKSSDEQIIQDSDTENLKIQSNYSEDTHEDTTIWMFPKSDRTQSTDSSSKLITGSEKEKIGKLFDSKISLKKTKSLSDASNCKFPKKFSKSLRSDRLSSIPSNINNLDCLILKSERSSLQRNFETEPKITKESISYEKFDRTSAFFTEYECRKVTMEKGVPEKLSNTLTVVLDHSEETLGEDTPAGILGGSNNGIEGGEVAVSDMILAGPSSPTTMDAASLPDMIGRNSVKGRPAKEKNFRKVSSPKKHRNEDPDFQASKPAAPTGENPLNESWYLLDETGQYQAVTRNEVTILLNGKSADAVLQGRKEHVISKGNSPSPNGSISAILTKESLQYFLREEDLGGEVSDKKSIELERKVENTLFYIQPGMNLTASIRIIPIETEMVHLWRRTRDNGSVRSSEVDLRFRSSQESVESPAPRNPNYHPSFSRRMAMRNSHQTLEEQDESTFLESSRQENHTNYSQEGTANEDYSNLLIETRMIVDNLTNSVKTLHNRLDGETSRSVTLQNEVHKLRHFIKSIGGRTLTDKNFRETTSDHNLFRSEVSSSVSLLTVKGADKADLRSDSTVDESKEVTTDPAFMSSNVATQNNVESEIPQEVTLKDSEANDNCITVNIYTLEETSSNECVIKVQETKSLLKANLEMIEGKMKGLQNENEVLAKQNIELKKKLKEISLELEQYLATTSDLEQDTEEDKELEALRNQVCNLKLELDNLKKKLHISEKQFQSEKSLMRKKLEEKAMIVDNWLTATSIIFQEIVLEKSRLLDLGVMIDVNFDPEALKQPKTFSAALNSYLQQLSDCLFMVRNHSLFQEKNLKEFNCSRQDVNEMTNLDQVISGYGELIEQCRKGSGEPGNKVMEDYFAVIMEKASLMEEIKILKTENEMLLEGQLEHYEKLKQTMIALKDRKNEISVLESSQKLSEEERSKMINILKNYEEEKRKLGAELSAKTTSLDELLQLQKKKDLEFSDMAGKLKSASSELKNFEKSCRIKDELINEFRKENDQLLISGKIKDDQIEILKKETQNLEVLKNDLECRMSSSEVLFNESKKEMTSYITHLEALINNSQESLEKTKLKLKESTQIIAKYKNENDVLDKQHQCDLKLYNKTKEELEILKEKYQSLSDEFNVMEEENENLQKKFQAALISEKEKSETIDTISKECKKLFNENSVLKEKMDVFSKDKDESLKEQKDLINKYALLSKEIQKLQEKYKNVKAECNERTDLIKYLEMMLKENLLEYNGRIACLEKNISRMTEKIAACKNCMKEKPSGMDAEVRELRHQLDVTYQERKELEHVVDNYYSLMKHLESEIQDREKKVDELQVKLSLGQQKVVDIETLKKFSQETQIKVENSESLKIEKLESQIFSKENELMECRSQLQNFQNNYENEKKKLELIIADLKSEINRYKIRLEVMMRNFSNYNKNVNGIASDKKCSEETNLQFMKSSIDEKNKKIAESEEMISRCKEEINIKESELKNCKKKIHSQEAEINNLRKQLTELKTVVFDKNRNGEIQQRERDEMAEKLLQSIKLIMEEKSARQAIELLATEKEKNLKDELDNKRNELKVKNDELEKISIALEGKNKVLHKLQEEVKKAKSEILSLKAQAFKNKEKFNFEKNQGPNNSVSLNQSNGVSLERLETCMMELKEVRDVNLQLRKSEGLFQAKIVKLEDEIRDARLLIKELQGDVKTEKKSKKALKNMIESAKIEIEKCLMAKQIVSVIADKIKRHLVIAEVPSRELLSGFRLRDSDSSPTSN